MEAKRESEPIENVAQQQVKKKERLIQRLFPHRGHTLFEFDRSTGKMEPAEYAEQDIVVNWKDKTNPKPIKKVVIKEGFLYISALNKKNAYKQLAKGMNGSKF